MKPEPRYKKGDKIGRRYQVHKALLGGMGEVYLCLDLEEMIPLALKTFQQRYLTDAQRLRRAFEQEVATWVALEKHPNIVRCFWMQMLDNQPFMCLEWIAGEEGMGTDLRGWLRRGPLDLKVALEVAIDICRGLIHAQAKKPGLVHRDLKPENILMVQGGLAKITDFGLAQVVQAAGLEVTQESAAADSRQNFVGGQGVVGTPAYTAPEQWRGEALDERTDIYALGCILYELLTGTLPFTVDFTPTTLQQRQRWLQSMQAAHESAPCPKLTDALPTNLNKLLQRCLAKTQAERPGGLTDLTTQLTNIYREQIGKAPPTRPAPGTFTAIDYTNRGGTYAALGERAAALADYAQAITLNPTDAQAYSNRGLTYHELGQLEAALADFTQALTLDPTFAQAYNNRGMTYVNLGKHEAALADFTQALTLDPNDAKAYYNRGLTYHELGERAAALADYTQTLTLDPNDAKAYYNRGVTYHELGERAAALADYTQTLTLDPNDAKAYYNRGNVYVDVGQLEAALADYTQALTLDPTFAQAYNNRGMTYVNLGKHEAALADLTQALTLNPTYVKAYSSRGVTYAESGQLEAALADFTQAITLDPTFAQAYNNRGMTYVNLGKHEAALADLTQALTLDPTFAQAYVNIGDLLGNQGRLAEALPYFEKAAHLGNRQGAQYAAEARQLLEMESEAPMETEQQALNAFVNADTLAVMQQAAARFPLLVQAEFMAAIEQGIAQQVPPAERPAFAQRLAWLRQIADTQQARRHS